MPRVVHFEISATDPEKIKAFYEEVFGWEINKWEGPVEYWLVKTGEEGTPGIDGGLVKPNETMAGTVNTIDVADVDEFMEKVRSSGGQVVTDKMTIPGVGYMAYCKDVEGTLFGLMQNDPKAGSQA